MKNQNRLKYFLSGSLLDTTYTAAVFFPSQAIERCKNDLDKQMEQILARSEEEKRDAAARKEQQRKQLVEHEAHQQELKESSRKKLLVRTHRGVHVHACHEPQQ